MRRNVVFASVVVLALLASGAAAFLASRGVFASPERSVAAAIEVIAPAPDAPLRLAFIGSSLTHGEAWTDLVAAELASCRPGDVSVMVLARPGAGSRWGVGIARDAIGAAQPAERPHIALIEFSINDASLARGVSVAESARAHRTIMTTLRDAGVAPVLLTLSHAVGVNGFERPGLSAYEDLYRTLSAQSRTPLIDLVPLWRAMEPEELAVLMPDGLHPTRDAGLQVTAPAIIEKLRPAICAPDRAHGASNKDESQ